MMENNWTNDHDKAGFLPPIADLQVYTRGVMGSTFMPFYDRISPLATRMAGVRGITMTFSPAHLPTTEQFSPAPLPLVPPTYQGMEFSTSRPPLYI